MNVAKLKTSNVRRRAKKSPYTSPLREEQAKLTQQKIEEAVFAIFEKGGALESITYKAVAKQAGVTEMTVFRYFPERSVLLRALWQRINQSLGPTVKMPESERELLRLNPNLHLGFDAQPYLITASITTQPGREMRAAINEERQKSFLKIVDELTDDLSVGRGAKLDPQTRIQCAAVLQLLHSAYAWDSMKQQWNMSGDQISEATTKAIQVLVHSIKKGKFV
jgi:AcrR family transcriptional regulator